MGGTIQENTGIAWVQKEYMDILFNTTQIELMKGKKKVSIQRKWTRKKYGC